MERLAVRRALRGSVALVTSCAMVIACNGSDATDGPGSTVAPTSTASPATNALVVDTDLAPDDLVALAFLLSSPDVDVRAVTVSGTGEVRCPAGLAVARGLLALTGDNDVPVACGRTTPLDGDREFPQGWRDAADDGWGLGLPPVTSPPTERSAVDVLIDVLEQGPATVVTLGPATNLAEVLRASPELVDHVESIVMMGGAVDVPGNVFDEGPQPPVAEWNFYVDPTAAAEVLASGAPIRLVGLDATNLVPVSGDLIDLLRVNSHTPAASFVLTALLNNPQVYEGGAYFWDPLAAASVLDLDVLSFDETPLSVVVGEDPEAGRTRRADGGILVDVGVDVDTSAFELLLVRTLDGVPRDAAPTAPAAPVAEIDVRYLDGACTATGPRAVPPGIVRFTFETDSAGWAGAVAPLISDLTDEQVIEWLETEDPGTFGDLGIGVVTMLFAVGGTGVLVEAPRLVVACGDTAGSVAIAEIVTVEP